MSIVRGRAGWLRRVAQPPPCSGHIYRSCPAVRCLSKASIPKGDRGADFNERVWQPDDDFTPPPVNFGRGVSTGRPVFPPLFDPVHLRPGRKPRTEEMVIQDHVVTKRYDISKPKWQRFYRYNTPLWPLQKRKAKEGATSIEVKPKRTIYRYVLAESRMSNRWLIEWDRYQRPRWLLSARRPNIKRVYTVQRLKQAAIKEYYGPILGQYFKNLLLKRFKGPNLGVGKNASNVSHNRTQNFLLALESRLDVMLWRINFCESIRQARHLISKGEVFVNGRRMQCKQTEIRPGDTIELHPRCHHRVRALLRRKEVMPCPQNWMEVDYEAMAATNLGHMPPFNTFYWPFPLFAQLATEFINSTRYAPPLGRRSRIRGPN